MRVLIIKTSSMGDIVHTLPALTDAGHAFKEITFDWVVEESFAEIPRWHPLVDKVIPVALRRWRKSFLNDKTHQEWKDFYKRLRTRQYDFVIDAQGLLKSAFLMYFVKGVRCGLNWQSAREPLASFIYQRRCQAGKIKEVHAVTRARRLFSEALGYKANSGVPDYGLDRKQFIRVKQDSTPYVVFLHGTTWTTKHWPEEYWIELALKLSRENLKIKVPWGNSAEQERALRMAFNCSNVEVLPKMKLAEVASVLAGSQAAVAVDTGLGHLAAALDVPTVSLYGPTNPLLTGTVGQSQIHLSTKFKCAPCLSAKCHLRGSSEVASVVQPPCFTSVTPLSVFKALGPFLE